ncbi:peptidoglycan recognition protein family protein [Micrococcus sp. M4NT]|uniref:peptidoglycan recognition protein family protein n=1 Tax=Micrococcus sp. M4NT TaxID=2957501 RepID=UPI0029A0F41A|nr:peptidoglycan recognition family protein [Micrococcus sp. M4NT]MDX2340255.1 peptidoglycan recognition protein family protein [Micrococcus sp. M4NT]
MADLPETTPRRRWPRRAVLGGTGIALASAAVACGSGDEAPEASASAGGDDRPRLPAPEILTTDDWGAVTPANYLQTLYERPSYLVIHHTTTPNTSDGSRQAAMDLARMVQKGHIAQGWGDSGQQFTLSRGGFPMEARHGSRHALEGGETFMLGIHALGFNAYALGIECEGFYMVNPPPQSLYAGLVRLSAYICQQYEMPPSRIIGHRDVVATSCCGDAFYAKLPILREDVRASLEAGEYRISEGFGAENLLDDAHVNAEWVKRNP